MFTIISKIIRLFSMMISFIMNRKAVEPVEEKQSPKPQEVKVHKELPKKETRRRRVRAHSVDSNNEPVPLRRSTHNYQRENENIDIILQKMLGCSKQQDQKEFEQKVLTGVMLILKKKENELFELKERYVKKLDKIEELKSKNHEYKKRIEQLENEMNKTDSSKIRTHKQKVLY